MLEIETLLAPISESAPCGQDITYDQEFLDLDSLLLGKAETQFSDAVKPDWKLARQSCLTLFGRSKHLQVAVDLTLASLQIDGLRGAAQGLELISKLLLHYWDDLHPKLDPDDNLDPLERMNVLGALTTPIGSYGDGFRFLERLHEAPLTNSPTLGRLSHARIHTEGFGEGAESEALEPSQIEAAFRDTPLSDLQETASALQSAIASVKEISAFLATVPGSEKAPDFDVLLRELKAILADVQPYAEDVPAAGAAPEATPGATPSSQTSGLPSGPTLPGQIQSRAQVVDAIDKLCTYYEKHEPSSPIPLLLKRARRLVHSDFLTIMTDLAPDAVAQIRTATGTTEDPK